MFEELKTAISAKEESSVNKEERIRLVGIDLENTIQCEISKQVALGYFNLSLPLGDNGHTDWDKLNAFTDVIGPKLEELGYKIVYPGGLYTYCALIQWS